MLLFFDQMEARLHLHEKTGDVAQVAAAIGAVGAVGVVAWLRFGG